MARTADGEARVLRRITAIAVLLAIPVFALSAWRAGDGIAQQACVDKVLAKYPAVSVSAYTSPDSSAMKLSFVGERQKALSSCS